MSDILLTVAWGCLSHDSFKNPCFNIAFPSNELLVETFNNAEIVLCDGLDKVLKSTSPPTVAWLVSARISAVHDRSLLPAKSWGIYLHILKKSKYKTRIYIGVATESLYGLRSRFKDYANEHAISQKLINSLNDGYKIVRSVILLHCPIPEPASQPLFRALLLALETAFHAIFWAMWNPEKSYGQLSDNRIWSVSSFSWQGLGTHSPLLESVQGLDLTDEQLDAIAKARRERKNAVLRHWAKAKLKENRANPTPEFLAERTKINKRRHKTRKAQREHDVANAVHRCDLCEKNYTSAKELANHKSTPLHLRREARGSKDFKCPHCSFAAPNKTRINRHIATHKKKLPFPIG